MRLRTAWVARWRADRAEREQRASSEALAAALADPEQRAHLEAMRDAMAQREPVPDDFDWLTEETP